MTKQLVAGAHADAALPDAGTHAEHSGQRQRQRKSGG